jgi:pimeloyl-ACP methyl ester carboxylesterase
MQVDAAVTQILELHGGQSINLIAHSGGTFVAGRYAETHPQRVARLVLFGAPAPYGKSKERSAVTTRYADVSREEELESFEPKVRDTRQLDPVMFDAWAIAYLATDPQSSSRNPPAVRVPAGFFASFAAMNRSGRLPYDPGKITTPTLVIQGEWDAVSPPASGLWVYERLAAPLKRFVILSRAGHRVHLERNRWQLYRETESFLNGGDES